jgi:hypothetical protein
VFPSSFRRARTVDDPGAGVGFIDEFSKSFRQDSRVDFE